jgi:hypothetical protein
VWLVGATSEGGGPAPGVVARAVPLLMGTGKAAP